MGRIRIKPIGIVRNNFQRPPSRKGWQDVISKIIIKKDLSKCLDGIEEYSHLVILYWMHKVKRDEVCFSEGAFAARTPFRPNPIGLTIVELVSRDGNILAVRGLDAYDGSLVIDIKPYTGHPRDLVLNFRSPDKF